MGDTTNVLGRLAAALFPALAVVAAFAGQDVNLDFFVTENAGRQTSFVIADTALRVK